MWGLLERHSPLTRIGDPPCSQLAGEFRSLTGVDPLGPACDR
jgi:hypothetical protein